MGQSITPSVDRRWGLEKHKVKFSFEPPSESKVQVEDS